MKSFPGKLGAEIFFASVSDTHLTRGGGATTTVVLGILKGTSV